MEFKRELDNFDLKVKELDVKIKMFKYQSKEAQEKQKIELQALIKEKENMDKYNIATTNNKKTGYANTRKKRNLS